jgi:hypothetical protein
MIPQIDHRNYQKKIKMYDEHSLRYIIKDCQQAIKALPDNPKNGYYADEISYCSMELNNRKNKRK